MKFLDHKQLQATALAMLGKPYQWGSKPDVTEEEPLSFDCSGFVKWVYGRCGFALPEGSEDQYMLSVPVEQTLQIGDVGFFMNQDGTTKHVGMLITAENVIEARGYEPLLEAAGIPTKRVLIRPRSKWENWHEFSGWRRLDFLK